MIHDIIVASMLFVTTSICTLGIFSHYYQDNLFERIGMALIGLCCSLQLVALVQRGVEPSIDEKLMYLGVFFFAVGRLWTRVHRYKQLKDPHSNPTFR